MPFDNGSMRSAACTAHTEHTDTWRFHHFTEKSIDEFRGKRRLIVRLTPSPSMNFSVFIADLQVKSGKRWTRGTSNKNVSPCCLKRCLGQSTT